MAKVIVTLTNDKDIVIEGLDMQVSTTGESAVKGLRIDCLNLVAEVAPGNWRTYTKVSG